MSSGLRRMKSETATAAWPPVIAERTVRTRAKGKGAAAVPSPAEKLHMVVAVFTTVGKLAAVGTSTEE
jgi:hypothetical protein